MDDLRNTIGAMAKIREEVLSLILGLPGNMAPDVIHLLRTGLEDLEDELEEAGSLIDHYDEPVEADCGCDPDYVGDEFMPVQHAEALCDWARHEDGRKVDRALEAIRGGHVSDLSLIF